MTSYDEKPSAYFGQVNGHVLACVRGTGLHILDIGCGHGELMGVLKARGQIARAYGVELFHAAADQARRRIDTVWEGDAESVAIDIPPGSLDYVILADVLEHLPHPERVLRRVRPLLKDEGRVVVSLPNVSFYRVWLRLLVGNDWRYEPQGVMDATHLRWFTTRSARRLLESEGFEVRALSYAYGSRFLRRACRLLAGLPARFLAVQMIYAAAPVPPAGKAGAAR